MLMLKICVNLNNLQASNKNDLQQAVAMLHKLMDAAETTTSSDDVYAYVYSEDKCVANFATE
jgi:hypothetical protein